MKSIKEQMIENATEAVQKGGVNSVTMRTLGDSVGIKSASVMYHFKNKDGLIDELIANYHQSFFNHLSYIDSISESPFEKLDRLVDIFEDVFDGEKFCLCGILAMQKSYLNHESKLRTKNFFNLLQKWIENILVEAKLDTDLSFLIISALEGALLVDQSNQTPVHLQKVRHWIQGLKN